MGGNIIKWENSLELELLKQTDGTWLKEYDEVRDLLKKQEDRLYCSFEFLNNLNPDVKIKYLKISHVFKGKEAFVYEVENLNKDDIFYINNYAIGVDSDEKSKHDLKIEAENVVDTDRNKAKDLSNVYDKLFIHFVIEVDGKNELYHHYYENIFSDDLFDMFKGKGYIDKNYINLLKIYVYFDPFHNDYTTKENDLQLRLSISTPMKEVIKIVKHQH